MLGLELISQRHIAVLAHRRSRSRDDRGKDFAIGFKEAPPLVALRKASGGLASPACSRRWRESNSSSETRRSKLCERGGLEPCRDDTKRS